MKSKIEKVLFLTQGEGRTGPGVWRDHLISFLVDENVSVEKVNTVPFRSMFKLFKVQKYDVVHAYHARGMTALFMIFARLLGKKTIYTVHGRLFEEYKTKSGIIKVLWMPAHHVCLLIADNVTFASNFLAQDTVQKFPYIRQKLSVIPNAIEFRPAPNGFEAKMKQTPNKLLAVTGFNYQQKANGLKPLIEATKRLRNDFPRLTLDILGDGRYLQDFRDAYAELDFVHFVGRANPLEYSQDAGIFVHSTFLDNSPMVLLEALNARLPTISVRVGGIPEILPDIALCEPNADSLERILRRAITSYDFRKDILEEGLENSPKFEISIVGRAMINVYG